MNDSAQFARLQQIDFDHVWHPFTQQKVWQSIEPLIIERGEGVELIDVQGRRYLDGVSSLWCNVHGHSVPELIAPLQQQAAQLCHSTLLGLSHRPILELTERLMPLVPKCLNRAFYADSGSTAVEAALRIALEYWQKQDSPAAKKKTEIISLEGAYHGDTLGAVGVGYQESFHSSLKNLVRPALRVPPPHIYRFYQNLAPELALEKSITELKLLLSKRSAEIAVLIIEPMVQGAAGIWVQPKEYLAAAAELCRNHNVLLIADEVATGFGKTGRMFAVDHAAVQPDILVLGKGLSAGYLPISAAVCSEKIFRGFIGEPAELKTFFYGQTFAGNPLAARVAAANLDLFAANKVMDSLPAKITHLHQELQRLIAPLPHVDEIRSCGLMIGIELCKTPGKRQAYELNEQAGQRIVIEARKRGAIVRPLGNVMVLMPALAMECEQLSTLVEITAEAIQAALG